MSKTIKVKMTDIQRMVESIVKEQEEWKGSTDPEIMALGQQGPEELGTDDSDVNDEDLDTVDEPSDDIESDEKELGDPDGIPLKLGKDEEGNFFIFKDVDPESGENPYVGKVSKK
jgi:hypothetical protein